MSIYTKNIDKMVDLAFRGYLDGAHQVLNKCHFTEEQREKIGVILMNAPSDHSTHAPKQMKERIIAVLNEEAVKVLPSLNEQPTCNSIVPFFSCNDTNIEQASAHCQDPVAGLEVQCPFFNNLHPDIIFNILCQCVKGNDILNLSHANTHWHTTINQMMKNDFNRFCPGITLDLEALNHISAFAILNCYKDMAPHVKNKAGISVITYHELTMDQLIDRGKSLNITIDIAAYILDEDRQLSLEDPCALIITNDIFEDSVDKDYDAQEVVVQGFNCQMLTARKAVYHCLRMFEISNGKQFPLEGIPPIFTRTSTTYGDVQQFRAFVVVGGCSSTLPSISVSRSAYYDYANYGVSGQRTFKLKKQ